MKGYSQSYLGPEFSYLPATHYQLYERVWDEADYVVPPAENGAFFITTNLVITPNQTLGQCPEVNYTNDNSINIMGGGAGPLGGTGLHL